MVNEAFGLSDGEHGKTFFHPNSQEVLQSLADTLQLSYEEISTLKDLAMLEAIPDHLKPEENILEKLPVFFRTVRGDKPTKEEMEKLIELPTK